MDRIFGASGAFVLFASTDNKIELLGGVENLLID